MTLQSVTIGNPLLPNQGAGGGGLFIKEGAVNMSKGAISANSATNAGGAQGNGAGVYVSSGSLTLTKVLVKGNGAMGGGGGMYVNSGTVKVSGGTVSANTAINNGGGIYVNGGTLTLASDVKINGSNSAGVNGNGGGMYINAGKVTMTGGSISSNLAGQGGTGNGGGIFNNAGSLTLKPDDRGIAVSVENNSITGQGGGLYLARPSTTMFAPGGLGGIACLVKLNRTAGGARNGVYEQKVAGIAAKVINPDNLNDADDPGGTPLTGP